MSNSEKSLNKINGLKEIELINNLLFYWMYYFIYSYRLIINFKKEFNICEKESLNHELKLQIYYLFIGLITVNIIIYALEEYQYFNLNIHSTINEIQLIFAYISIYFFFIIYSILLNLIILKNINIKIIKSIILITLKIFNLLYPLVLLYFSFFFDIMITNQIEFDSNQEIIKIISNNSYLSISFILITFILIFIMGYVSFNFIKKYKGIKSKIKIFSYFVSIYILSLIISQIFIYPYTLAPLLKNIQNSNNFCENVLKIKFKIKENYTFDNYGIDLKQCYKAFP